MQPVLSIENLTVSRTNVQGTKRILSKSDLDLNEGELVRIIGPSGCGKTSLLLALAQLIPIDSGVLSVRGESFNTMTPQKWRTRVAMVLQTPIMVPGTVRDNIVLSTRLFRAQRERVALASQLRNEGIRRELDLVGLTEITLDADATQLSVGQKARVSLLRSLLTQPDCVLLDEPYAALDEDSQALVAKRIKSFVKDGNAVLMVHHGMLDDDVSYTLQLKEQGLQRVAT